MKLNCIHFAQHYDDRPGGSHDLIGMFDTLPAPRLPIRRTFWVYAQIEMEADEGGAPVPITLRLTTPNGQVFDETSMPVLDEPTGHHPPVVWWAHQLDIELGLAGYYTFTIIDTEWGKKIGSRRLLVRAGG